MSNTRDRVRRTVPQPKAGMGLALALAAAMVVGPTRAQTPEEQLSEFSARVQRIDAEPAGLRATDLMGHALRSLSPEAVYPMWRELLVGTRSSRLASELRGANPTRSLHEWRLWEAVATRAGLPEMRLAAQRMLRLLAEAAGNDSLGNAWGDPGVYRTFEPTTAMGYLYRGLAFAIEATHAKRPGEVDRADPGLARAFADFDGAIRKDPWLADAYLYRGEYRQWTGQSGAALEDLNESIRLAPACADAYRIRAAIHGSLGHPEESALDSARGEGVRAAEREAWLRSEEGFSDERSLARDAVSTCLALQARGDDFTRARDDALEHLGNIARCHPNELMLRLDRGLLRQLLGEHAGALPDFDALLREVPDAFYVELLRSKSLDALGRSDEAAEARGRYEAGVGRFPGAGPPAQLLSAEGPELALTLDEVRLLAGDAGRNVEALARVLVASDSDAAMREEAVRGLASLAPGRLAGVRESLERAAVGDGLTFALAGNTAVELLGELREPASVEALLGAGLLGDEARRNQAVKALGKLPADAAASALCRLVLALPDEDAHFCATLAAPYVPVDKWSAAWTKAVLGAPRALQVRALVECHDPLILVETLRDDRTAPEVRRQAIALLREQAPELATALAGAPGGLATALAPTQARQ